MPYESVKDLPPRIKKYSAKIQRMFMKVFNKKYIQVIKTDSKKDADTQAMRLANGIIKKNIEKFGASRYGQRTAMQYMVDSFLEKNR